MEKNESLARYVGTQYGYPGTSRGVPASSEGAHTGTCVGPPPHWSGMPFGSHKYCTWSPLQTPHCPLTGPVSLLLAQHAWRPHPLSSQQS
jgi:hypothetical protein